MNINIKGVWDFLLSKVRKYPVFTRILTQAVLLITTFGWHNSSDFWHVICLASMVFMSVLNVSDGKLRRVELGSSEEVVEILQEAISEIIETNAVGVSESFAKNIPVPTGEEEAEEELQEDVNEAKDANEEESEETNEEENQEKGENI